MVTRRFSYRNEIVSGVLMGLAQQPVGLGFIAWFGFIPWFISFPRHQTRWALVASYFIWGCAYHLTTIFWLAFNIGTSPLVAVISMTATVIFLSIMMLPSALLMYFIQQKSAYYLWAFPVIWACLEYFRAQGSLAFPWVSIANTQTQFLLPIQNAEITGIYGISFWIVMLNVMIYYSFQKGTRFRVFAAAFFLLPWITGFMLYPGKELSVNPIKVAVVQPNIPLSEKWDDRLISTHIEHLIDLSLPAVSDGADLIVWPETAPPVYLLRTGKHYLRKIQKILEGTDTAILTGVPHYKRVNNEIESYNSAIMFNSDQVLGVYNKMQLVPMAEYVPLSGVFPSLKELNFGQANFTRGDEYTLYPLKNWQVGSVICFESTIPQLVREFILAGADVMVIVTNDGWYKTAPEPQQHAKQAIYRAIETRKPVIRCANTGISMFIDTAGNIISASRLNDEVVLSAQIQPNTSMSFFVRWGDLFSLINLVVLAGIFLFLSGRKNYV